MTSRLIRAKRDQLGLTLVELLVALVISTVIVIAAVSALIVSRQGFSTVDAASQLRDNARFATDLIQRLGVQAGFDDVWVAASNRPPPLSGIVDNPPTNVFGFNNATSSSTDPLNASTSRTGTTTVGYGSDVLILRYQTVAPFLGATVSDRSMIDCFGNSPTGLSVNRDDRWANVLYVGLDGNNEPALMCRTDTNFTEQPVVRGVENFQVLYGVDGVTANTLVTASPTFTATNYLRADQFAVASDPDGSKTNANWRRVRSIRVGMVLRAPLGSSQGTSAQIYYPLGQAINAAGGSSGSAMSSTNDPGTIYAPAADSRLRQVVTFTIHLRNEQGL
jgi:type IV pilus assembly protein PilW